MDTRLPDKPAPRRRRGRGAYQRWGKRTLDVALSATALVVLSPVMAATALLLHFANQGAGVMFRQPRPGRDARMFNIFKFKTMNDRRGPDGVLLPDLQRLTPVGRVVRSLSLDELPQLWNVLRGDMSLIGPRPLLQKYLPLYSPEQARRHQVRPGITGWAQCHGRNSLSWAERFRLDVWYVDHVSLRTDLSIIWTTALKVIKREGIEGAATDSEGHPRKYIQEPFNGHN